jgi:hypothetical protein
MCSQSVHRAARLLVLPGLVDGIVYIFIFVNVSRQSIYTFSPKTKIYEMSKLML